MKFSFLRINLSWSPGKSCQILGKLYWKAYFAVVQSYEAESRFLQCSWQNCGWTQMSLDKRIFYEELRYYTYSVKCEGSWICFYHVNKPVYTVQYHGIYIHVLGSNYKMTCATNVEASISNVVNINNNNNNSLFPLSLSDSLLPWGKERASHLSLTPLHVVRDAALRLPAPLSQLSSWFCDGGWFLTMSLTFLSFKYSMEYCIHYSNNSSLGKEKYCRQLHGMWGSISSGCNPTNTVFSKDDRVTSAM